MAVKVGDKFTIKDWVCIKHNRQELIDKIFVVGSFFKAVSGRCYVKPLPTDGVLKLDAFRAIDIRHIIIINDELIPFSEVEIDVLLGI